MKKIFLIDNVYSECTASSYLFNKVKNFFLLNWYDLVDSELEATDILINTCGVWTHIENKQINYIDNLLKKFWSKKKIYVYGCLSWISPRLIKNYSDKVVLIPTKKDYLLDNYFEHSVSIRNIDAVLVNKWKIRNPATIFSDNKKRFYVSISRWCVHNCSYCVIKRAIGYVTSRKPEEILKECEYAVKNWYNEIVLVSDDAGSYGLDIGISFDVLFNEICKIEWNYQIDINYVEPWIFSKIFPKISYNFYKVSRITCPIQSYNDRLLELMNRKYTVSLFIDLIDSFRKAWDKSLKVINHIIYGYPTETFKEFKRNLEYLNVCDSNLFILYSYREWTKKFDDNQLIMPNEIKKRTKILLKLNKINPIKVDLANFDV